MSILIHAPSQVQYGSRHVHPHPHSTQPPPSYDAKQLLREEEDFARSHLSREEAFARKYFSEKNAWFKPINSGHRIVLFKSRTLRSFTHLNYPTEERTLGSAWVTGVSQILGNLSRSPPENFLCERLYFAPLFSPNDLCAHKCEQGFTYVH